MHNNYHNYDIIIMIIKNEYFKINKLLNNLFILKYSVLIIIIIMHLL